MNDILPVDYGVQDENSNEWGNDVQYDICPQSININIPEIHPETLRFLSKQN